MSGASEPFWADDGHPEVIDSQFLDAEGYNKQRTAKKKNDRIDANKICDCLRCDFLPVCYMASTAIRERRRTLRNRNLLVRQMVQMKTKICTLLIAGCYDKERLHKAGYFRELLASNPDINEGLRSLLKLCRER